MTAGVDPVVRETWAAWTADLAAACKVAEADPTPNSRSSLARWARKWWMDFGNVWNEAILAQF